MRANKIDGLVEVVAEKFFAGKQTDEEIGAELGVSRTTLLRWKSHPVIVARVRDLREKANAAQDTQAIAVKTNRVAAMNDRWIRMQRVIAERASGMGPHVPGGCTGLLVRQVKQGGVEYAVDTGLLREMRELERAAAVEMDQISSASDDAPMPASGGQEGTFLLQDVLVAIRTVVMKRGSGGNGAIQGG